MDILGDTIAGSPLKKPVLLKPVYRSCQTVADGRGAGSYSGKAPPSKSTLYQLGEQFNEVRERVHETQQNFRSRAFPQIDGLGIKLSGAHQRTNAAAAIMALEVLRQYYALMLDDEHLTKGLRQRAWPGRWK